jgi:hypothetical protein
MTEEDVRIDANGMTITGGTLRMIEALAQELGLEPIEALRMALNSASTREDDKA